MNFFDQKSRKRRITIECQSHKSRLRQMRTFAIVALLTAAWIGSVAAQEITPGKWTGGNPENNTPFFICLNVSQDGQRLTPVGTQCLGNQGQNRNSIEINWQSGTTPEGSACNQNSYRGADQGDVAIGPGGYFTHTYTNAFVKTTVIGRFDRVTQTASGTARTITVNPFFSINCAVEWNATPADEGPPETLPPPTTAPPAPAPGSTALPGIAPGQWIGGNPGSNIPFSVCLNVSQDGQRLTSVGTQCTGNQGQNRNSIDINWQTGTTPEGFGCHQYSYRGDDLGDLQIGPNGYFTHSFSNAFVNTTVIGKFDPATQTASGYARTINPYTNCAVQWTARPTGTP